MEVFGLLMYFIWMFATPETFVIYVSLVDVVQSFLGGGSLLCS